MAIRKESLSASTLRLALAPALLSLMLLGGSARAAMAPEDPYKETILVEGNAWQLKNMQGAAQDETGKITEFSENVFSLQRDGLAEVPLAEDIRAELLADVTNDPQTVYTLNQRILDDIEVSKKQGYLTPSLEAIAEPEDGTGTPAELGGPVMLSGCSDQIRTYSKSLTLNSPLNFSTGLGGGFSGSLSSSGTLSGAATGSVTFAVKRTKVLWWCIPYGVRFQNARAVGDAVVASNAALNGSINYTYSWQTEIAKPGLGSLSFWIGPVPVYIGFNLPINLGLDLQASVTGSIGYSGSQSASAHFDYTCTLSACTGSSTSNYSTSSHTITGSVSGRVYPNVWVQAAVRAYLYTEWVAYAQVGVRPYLRGDLWGYYGNTCGDANGDGTNETVSALTFDLDWQLYFTAAARAFGGSPSNWTLWTSPRYHIYFWDLINSSAITPMISGPSIATVNVSQSYSAKMRPCWPYGDTTSYSFNWGDGFTTPLSGLPQTWVPASHTWTTTGTKLLGLTALRDSHGRTFSNKTTTRNIQVLQWTAWLDRDDPGGVGDFETLSDFLAAGQACTNPAAIQCQTLGGVDWTLTGEVYSCTAGTGGVCVNADQPDGSCQDYRVRFLCP